MQTENLLSGIKHKVCDMCDDDISYRPDLCDYCSTMMNLMGEDKFRALIERLMSKADREEAPRARDYERA